MKHETTLVMVTVLILTAMGVMMVYSATAIGGDPYGLLYRQLRYAGIGLVAFFVCARLNYRRLCAPLWYRTIMVVSLILLGLVLIPGLGQDVAGARRWLRLGPLQFQPSELAKFALVLWLAVKLTANQAHIRSFLRGFLPPVVVASIFAGLILAERDLGLPVVLMGAAMLVMWNAGTRWIYLAGCGVLCAIGTLVLVLITPHRLVRLLAFLDPWAHRDDASYQLVQSLRAFAQGGLTGQGIGWGQQKLEYLFASSTDFVFSVIGEEMGLAGSVGVIVVFLAFMFGAFRIMMNAKDMFGSLLACGITSMILLQTVFIMAVTVGLLPTKGLPLPFISYGGTSLVVYLALAGLLVSVGARATEETDPQRNLMPGQQMAASRA